MPFTFVVVVVVGGGGGGGGGDSEGKISTLKEENSP